MSAPVITFAEQLRKVGELAVAHDDISKEEWACCERIWAAQTAAGIEKCEKCGTACGHTTVPADSDFPEPAREQMRAARTAYREMARRRDQTREDLEKAIALARELRLQTVAEPAPAARDPDAARLEVLLDALRRMTPEQRAKFTAAGGMVSP